MGLRGQDTNSPNFAARSRRHTFSIGAAPPLSVAHQAVFPHGSMNFRSFDPVNGLRPPEAAREKRAIDNRKTSEKRGFREVDGAPRRTGAGRLSRWITGLRQQLTQPLIPALGIHDPSWPGLSRPSTRRSCFHSSRRDRERAAFRLAKRRLDGVDGRDKPGHDESLLAVVGILWVGVGWRAKPARRGGRKSLRKPLKENDRRKSAPPSADSAVASPLTRRAAPGPERREANHAAPTSPPTPAASSAPPPSRGSAVR